MYLWQLKLGNRKGRILKWRKKIRALAGCIHTLLCLWCWNDWIETAAVCGQMIDWERGFIVNWWDHAWRSPVIVLFSEVLWKMPWIWIFFLWSETCLNHIITCVLYGPVAKTWFSGITENYPARQDPRNIRLWLVNSSSILASDWSRQVTWPECCPLIGWLRSGDLMISPGHTPDLLTMARVWGWMGQR